MRSHRQDSGGKGNGLESVVFDHQATVTRAVVYHTWWSLFYRAPCQLSANWAPWRDQPVDNGVGSATVKCMIWKGFTVFDRIAPARSA
ncbi:hypothetical protein SM139_1175 [Stenotrophomonas maltophilia]|jgi:hypothetical protein|nr:hypothetical protein SM139_1175 [Stenotrophomonas maltophilia]